MSEELTSQISEPTEEVIGEEFNDQSSQPIQDEITEDPKEKEAQKGTQETVAQKKQRSREELVELATEFYGVDKDEVIVDKNGDLKLVMKINGKKRLVTPQEFKKGFNLNQAGYEKLNEGKQLVKQVQQAIDGVKGDPRRLWALADDLGIDKYTLAQQLLEEKIRESEMTDEERKSRTIEQKLKDLEEENKKLKAAEEQKRLDALKNEQVQKYDTELTSALKKHGFSTANKKVKSHILMGAIGKLMLANQAHQELSCDDAVYLAKQEWQDYTLGIMDEIDDNHIVNLLPERVIKAIRKADIARLDQRIPTSKQVADDIDQQLDLPEVDSPKRRRKVSMSDYFNSLTG